MRDFFVKKTRKKILYSLIHGLNVLPPKKEISWLSYRSSDEMMPPTTATATTDSCSSSKRPSKDFCSNPLLRSSSPIAALDENGGPAAQQQQQRHEKLNSVQLNNPFDLPPWEFERLNRLVNHSGSWTHTVIPHSIHSGPLTVQTLRTIYARRVMGQQQQQQQQPEFGQMKRRWKQQHSHSYDRRSSSHGTAPPVKQHKPPPYLGAIHPVASHIPLDSSVDQFAARFDRLEL